MYTWEWMETWWETFGRERSLVALIERTDGEVVAIAPFVRRTARMNRLFTFRRMELMGTGEEEWEEVFSEFVDMPARPGTQREVLNGLAKSVLALRREHRWDDVVLRQVQPASAVCQAFQEAAAEPGLGVALLHAGKSPYVVLPDSLDEYERQLTRDMRRQVRRGFRHLNNMGPVSFQKAQTEGEALSTLTRLAELHQARWAAKGEEGAFASSRFVQFHRRFIHRTFRMGWLDFWTFRVGQEAIACLYNIRYQGRVSAYQSGMSPLRTTAISPGMFAHYLAIKDAIETGAKEYDFMLGEQPYKLRLSNAFRDLVTVRISRRSLKERARRNLAWCVAAARRLLPAVRRKPQ